MNSTVNMLSIETVDVQECANIPIVDEEKHVECSTLDHKLDKVNIYLQYEAYIQVDDVLLFTWHGIRSNERPLVARAKAVMTQELIDLGELHITGNGKKLLEPLQGGSLQLYYKLYRGKEVMCSSTVKKLKVV